ncbi:HNH endonuclease [Pseudomonas lundensis]|uniref:HNH endonuclease n=1 Tax=Pseudomonas lundensis TaxID=86185 RepID=UPI0014756A03|nr:hypothetical protein [Pseudomonas lundensis]NMZ98064.1 hypothetical protein [Pseudomonas lundensis]
MSEQNRKSGVNKYGLPRNIPSDIKREVRKRCGFGCIFCGCGIIQYEHVDPEFHEAKFHDPGAIVTLCPTCHASVTSKFWSKERIKRHALDPVCLKKGYLKHVFDFYSDGHPSVQFGGALLKNCHTPVEIFGTPLISIKPPECKGGPFLLSGTFCDRSGSPTLRIIDNEWIAYSDSWDVEVSAGGITVRNGPGDIVLRLSVRPPHTLVVERLKMTYGVINIDITSDELVINTNTFTGCVMDGFAVGLSVYSPQRFDAYSNLTPLASIVKRQIDMLV